jgi:sec-independent protein translocase protein TatA
MGTFSLGHWLVVIVVVLIMFGAGRLPKAMGDLARGLRAFRSGLQDEQSASVSAAPQAPSASDRVRG